jgi:hypothetical protein
MEILLYLLFLKRAGIAQYVRISTGYGLDGRSSILDTSKICFHNFQTGSKALPAPYQMSTENYFLGSKAAGA